VLSAAVYLLLFHPVRGVMQALVNAWFTHNLLLLWLTPLGLALLHYFIPKQAGRPLYSRQLALFTFWILAFIAPWGGLARLGGGPLPSWMISTSIAANGILILPVLCAVANLWLTLGNWGAGLKLARQDLVFRFMLFSSGAYLLAGVLLTLTSFRSVSLLTQFTYIPMLLDHLLLLGFFGMAGFGAVYFVLPRVTGMEWPSPKLARWHRRGSVWGLTLYSLALLVGGLIHGARMNNPQVEFMAAVKSTLPWVGISTLGLLLFLAGQVALLINVQKMAWLSLTPTFATVWAFFQDAPAKTTNKEVAS
jgi:cytochrome c oxidase cbb3-type subunit 1